MAMMGLVRTWTEFTGLTVPLALKMTGNYGEQVDGALTGTECLQDERRFFNFIGGVKPWFEQFSGPGIQSCQSKPELCRSAV